MQPGQTIGPDNSQSPQESTPQVPPVPQKPEQEVYEPVTTNGNSSTQAPQDPISHQDAPEDTFLSWSASEFIEHQKPVGWYGMVIVGGFVLSVLVFFLLGDILSAVVVALAAIMFAFVGSHKPNARKYSITEEGVSVDGKTFAFEDFKYFSLLEEGVVDMVQLYHLKQYIPPVSMYFPPEMADEILGTLSTYLPHEEKDHAMVDKLMNRLKF